jgi:hypothetical protein
MQYCLGNGAVGGGGYYGGLRVTFKVREIEVAVMLVIAFGHETLLLAAPFKG